ncbi:MAG: TonB-dependent receptor [Bacteroidota bacterium]
MKQVFIIFLFLPCVALSQMGTLEGKVVGSSDPVPLPGVNVLLRGTQRGTVTATDGTFRIKDVPPGVYTISFSLVGYQRESQSGIVIASGETTQVDLTLTSLPILTEGVVVTASKREQSLQEVPVSISVADAASLSFRNTITLDDALRYVPGVNLTEYQVNIRGSSGYSRGVGSRVLMLVDGIPFLTGDTGELNFESLPIGQVERIEVVKGASSALYGSSALGGVVNVLTKSTPEQSQTRIRTFGGFYGEPSFRQWDWKGGTRFLDGQSLSHSFTSSDVGAVVYGSRFADDGYRQNDFRRRYNGYMKVRYTPSTFESVTTTFNILHQKRGSFLYWDSLKTALVPPIAQQGDQVQATRFFLSGQYNRSMSQDFLLAVKALWFRNRWDDTIDTLTNNSRSDVLRGEVQGTWSPVSSHIMTFGVEGNTDNVEADLFGSRSGGGFAAYAQDEIQLIDELKATIGGRFDYQDLDSLDASSQFNPKAGLVYSLVAGTTFRASYGRGFRAPAAAEAFVTTEVAGLEVIPNPALDPERSVSYEIGVNQLLGETALLDVALFHNDFYDLIEPRFVSVAGELKAQFHNVTRARVQGFEFSTKLGLFEKSVFFDLGYTYVYPRDVDLRDILKYRPRHVLHLSGLAHAGMFMFGADFRYVSRVERIDEEFNFFVDKADQRVAIYLTDLRIGVDLIKTGIPLSATVNVHNLFQYNYVELVGNLAPPRRVILTLEAKL